MKNQKAQIKVVLYKSKGVNQEGKFPIKVRVTYARKVKYYALGIYSTEEAFNDTNQPPTIDHGKRSDNKAIAERYTKAEAAIQKIADSGKDFTFHLFEKEYQFTATSKKAGDFIDSIVNEQIHEQRFSTANTYKDCKSSLESFHKALSLNQIDLEFLNKYTRHLHKRLSPASVGIHLRTLRAIINNAIDKRILPKDSYPFNGFTGMPNNKQRSKKALSKEKMIELFDQWKNLSKSEKYSGKWQSLSLFLFSYFVAGINLEDILRLTDKNLHEGNLKFVRKKTTQEIEIPLHPIAAQILADFSTVSDEEYLFPFMEGKLSEKTARHRKLNLLKKVNADLKTIAGDIGISPFTFYSARHSFASVLHSQNTSTSDIGDYLGHTSEATTKNYLASIETERKKEAFGKLL